MKLRSPTICHLKAGDPGKSVVKFEGLRAGEPLLEIPGQV